MNNLNSVIVEGNLTKDPFAQTTPSGKLVCKFTIANNRYYKVGEENQQEVSFFTVETWGKVAESCAEYLKKGRGVRVVGRLKQERWKDQEDNARERAVLVAEHVEFKPQYPRREELQNSPEQMPEEPGGSEEGSFQVFVAESEKEEEQVGSDTPTRKPRRKKSS
jgi:single-strand DNA-binding protein